MRSATAPARGGGDNSRLFVLMRVQAAAHDLRACIITGSPSIDPMSSRVGGAMTDGQSPRVY